MIRTIDALKAFDTIFVITQGGPGTASETINIYLYQQAFAYYDLGYASAIVVVFFVHHRGARAGAALRAAAANGMSVTGSGHHLSSRPARIHRYRVGGSPGASGSASRCIVLVSPALFVFLWMLSLSLKNEVDNMAYPPVFIPRPADAGELRQRVRAKTTS